MTTIESKSDDRYFWKNFPTMAAYFAPAVAPLQKHFGIGTKELFFSLGEILGRSVAERYSSLDLKDTLAELSSLWERLEIGRLEVEKKEPLTLMISNCTICGQLPGTGWMYECAFHEGFFQSLLSAKVGRKVSLHQDTNFEGTAGTWCRRFVADVELEPRIGK